MKIFTKHLIVVFTLFFGLAAQAQKTTSVGGRILNSRDKQPVDYASVVLKRLTGDSSVVGSAVTAPTGTFEIKDIAPGNYRLFAAFLGYKTFTKDIVVGTEKINVGDISLDDSGVNVQEVEVRGQIPPVVVKKDTLEFNAAAFKVKENAVVEDVLKKLPGVDVAKDGTITAQGEQIKRVRVDGKDFMGSDPLLATRNLPADMIDKIQIIDDLSDQSKFSGVDDGNREKIINITTRQDKKNGFFGNSTIAAGTDERYDASINVNKFKNDQQFSIIGQFNNVNKQSFGGGGGFGGGRNFGGGGNNGGGSGITTTNAFGINFADVYSDLTQFNGSYFFNKTNVFNTSNSLTQNLFGSNITTVNNQAVSDADRLNHRLNFTIDTKLDSTTSIRIQPTISYTESDGNSSNVYDRNVLTSKTVGSQTNLTNSTSPSFGNNLLIRKKFQRRGRTISLNMNTSINDSDSENFNIINDNVTIGTGTTIRLTNQLNDNASKSINNTARLVFTEPLSKTMNMEFNYTNSYSFSNIERFVYNYNAITNQYDLLNNTFTTDRENTVLGNALGFSLSKTEKKYNWNAGIGAQRTNREQVNLSNGQVLNQDFWNLTPTAQYRYTFSQNKRLEINYRGNQSQPSIEQLQPTPDNTNTQSIVIGNPNLKPSFGNSIRINYRNFNFATFRTMFAYVNFNQTFNDFATSSVLITNPADVNFGKIAITSVNVSGNYNANGGVNVGFPLIPGNKLTLSVGANLNLSKAKTFANGIENINDQWGGTGTLKLVSNLDKFDLTAGLNVRYTNAQFSAVPTSNTDFYTITPNVDISYLFPGNIRLQADVYYNKITGQGPGFDTDYTLVNSYISRQFFKNRGTFKIAVNDLFNQNTGISRTANGTTIQDINFNVLKRYYTFGFTYSLNRVGGKTISGQGQQGAPMMRMGGGRN